MLPYLFLCSLLLILHVEKYEALFGKCVELGDRTVRGLVLGSFGGVLVCEENSGDGRADIQAVFQ